MSDEIVKADFDACDALLCEDETRDDFIAENIDRIEIWKKAAESGDAAGQLLYGLCFFYGHGEQEDEKKAVQWFLKSAEQVNAQAQCSIGICYQQGWGVEDDVEVANEWFAKAAVQGHKKACEELPLAMSIQLGIGTHKPLTKEIAETFVADEDSVDLSEFTTIEDDAACILGQYDGDSISLYGLVSLSDAAAETLSKYRGDLYCDESALPKLSRAILLNKLLTKEIAKSYIEDENTIDLNEFDLIEDQAAGVLSEANPNSSLDLDSLVEISDSAAESLSKYKGVLFLSGLTGLSESAAKSLSDHKGDLVLNGLKSLPLVAVESLSKYQGGWISFDRECIDN